MLMRRFMPPEYFSIRSFERSASPASCERPGDGVLERSSGKSVHPAPEREILGGRQRGVERDLLRHDTKLALHGGGRLGNTSASTNNQIAAVGRDQT